MSQKLSGLYLLGLHLLSLLLLLLDLLLLLAVTLQDVNDIVDWSVPLLACVVNLLLELDSGFLLTHVEEESLLDPLDRD